MHPAEEHARLDLARPTSPKAGLERAGSLPGQWRPERLAVHPTEERARTVAKEMKREREQFWTMHNEKWCCLPFEIYAAGQL